MIKIRIISLINELLELPYRIEILTSALKSDYADQLATDLSRDMALPYPYFDYIRSITHDLVE